MDVTGWAHAGETRGSAPGREARQENARCVLLRADVVGESRRRGSRHAPLARQADVDAWAPAARAQALPLSASRLRLQIGIGHEPTGGTGETSLALSLAVPRLGEPL